MTTKEAWTLYRQLYSPKQKWSVEEHKLLADAKTVLDNALLATNGKVAAVAEKVEES